MRASRSNRSRVAAGAAMGSVSGDNLAAMFGLARKNVKHWRAAPLPSCRLVSEMHTPRQRQEPRRQWHPAEHSQDRRCDR